MSLHELPRIETAHVDESGDIQFYTADGREGVITELGSTLLSSADVFSTGDHDAYYELPVDSFVEPAERPRQLTAAEEHGMWNGGAKYDKWTRGAGHVSKDRK